MSFLDKAKAAATDFAAKADQALGQAGLAGPGGGGDADRALRDLGVLAWQELNGQPTDAQAKETVVSMLRRLESEGRLGSLTLTSAYAVGGAVPPPPGAAAQAAAQQAAPPPPPAGAAPPPPTPAAPAVGNSEAADRAQDALAAPPGPEDPYAGEPAPGPAVPPPPPPSWAKGD